MIGVSLTRQHCAFCTLYPLLHAQLVYDDTVGSLGGLDRPQSVVVRLAPSYNTSLVQNNYTNSKIAQHTALKILSIVIYENSITRYCLTKHNKLSWVFVMQTPMCIAVALICLLCSLQKFLENLKIFANVFLWCLHLQCSKHLEYKIWTHSHNIL